jgi:hypothetical protein
VKHAVAFHADEFRAGPIEKNSTGAPDVSRQAEALETDPAAAALIED